MPPLWSLERGAQLQPDNSTRFSVWAPHLRAPRVRICSGPARGDYVMEAVEDDPGAFAVTVRDASVGTDYVLLTDDGREVPDPLSRWQPNGVHGASRVFDPNAHEWNDMF